MPQYTPFQYQSAPMQGFQSPSMSFYTPPPQQQQQQQGMNPMSIMDMMGNNSPGQAMQANSAAAASGQVGAGSSAEIGSLGIGNPGAYGGSSASIGGGGGGSAMGGAGIAAIVAAIIVAQHQATDSVKDSGRSYMGHTSGDAFSGDFFSEPWESYGLEQLGIDTPSPGERTDAFFQTGDYGRGIASLPRTGARWFDPVGDFGYQYGQDQLGDAGGFLDPLRWGLDQLS